jgi:hypothetical protein
VTEHGYTYTTLTGRPGEEMRVDTTFYLDETAYIRVVAAGTDRAFLSIDQGAVRVTISARSDVQLSLRRWPSSGSSVNRSTWGPSRTTS